MPFTHGFSSGFSTGFNVASPVNSYSATGSGGVTVGGSAPYTAQRFYAATGSGGVTIAGAAPSSRGWGRSGSGGVIVAGSAAPAIGRVFVGAGGVVVGGSAPATFTRIPSVTWERGRSYSGTGWTDDRDFTRNIGLVIARAGAAGAVRARATGELGMTKKKPHQPPAGQAFIDTWRRAGSGGVRVGGTAPYTFYQSTGVPITSPTAYTIYAHGGVIVGGSAPFSKRSINVYRATGSGGVKVGGTASAQYVGRLAYNRVGAGGVLVRGAAPATFTPAPTVPGGGTSTVFRTPTPAVNWGPEARTKPVVTGATWNVANNADFTAALNGFAPGDEIVIAVGARLSGQFFMPNRNGANQWVTIRTAAAIDTVCPPGRRMNPGKASTLNLGQLATPGGNAPSIDFRAGAQGFYFIGLDLRLGGSCSAAVGAGNINITSPADVCKRIVFDRCLAIGGTTYACNRFFRCLGEKIAIFDSWIADVYGTGDTQGIWVYGWQGPYYFDNNHVEGWTENFMSGGGEIDYDPTDVRTVPADIVFTHNHVIKNPAYRTAPPFGCTVKNLLEFKTGRRIECAYNIFEQTWPDGQATAVNMKSVDQVGGHPLQGTQDVHFHHNWIRFVAGGVLITANPQNPTYAINPLHRVYQHDNLWEYVNTQAPYTGNGVMVQFAGGIADVTLEHETFVVASADGVTAFVVEYQAAGAVAVVNSILRMDGYGLKMSGGSSGTPSWNAFQPNSALRTWQKNVLVAVYGNDASGYPQPSVARLNDAAVGYANLGARDYTVTGALATYATDGGPAGVSDFSGLMTALAPVLNG